MKKLQELQRNRKVKELTVSWLVNSQVVDKESRALEGEKRPNQFFYIPSS